MFSNSTLKICLLALSSNVANPSISKAYKPTDGKANFEINFKISSRPGIILQHVFFLCQKQTSAINLSGS